MKIFGLLFWLCVLLIGYVYVGYPLIIAFLARLKRRQPDYPTITPHVSMLIAAYNEERIIGEKIENTLALNYPREFLQIVVAVDGSDDRTVEIVQAYAERGVELSYQSLRNGKAAAINRAMPLLKHDIVVFSDANNFYAPDALIELVKPFSDSKVGAVTGSKNLLDESDALVKADGLYWRYESSIKQNETRLGSCTGAVGEIMAVRRRLYQAPPAHVINDDFVIGLNVLRQGYRLVYAPKARSFERGSPSEREEAIRRSRIVAGRYQAMLMAGSILPWDNPLVVWQIISHKFMRPLVPLMMIVAFLASMGALFRPPQVDRFEWLYLAAPYNFLFFAFEVLLAVLAVIGGMFKGRGLLGKLLYLPAFLVNSNVSAVLGLYSFFTGRQTSLWRRVRRRGEIS
jgi:cellulose synthase/poly-beta-1,6-N-acetylglucosamine synthase-like glycosyltransferase